MEIYVYHLVETISRVVHSLGLRTIPETLWPVLMDLALVGVSSFIVTLVWPQFMCKEIGVLLIIDEGIIRNILKLSNQYLSHAYGKKKYRFK